MKKNFKWILLPIVFILGVLAFDEYKNNKEVNEFLDLIENVSEDYTASILTSDGETHEYILTDNELLEIRDNLLEMEYKANFNNLTPAGEKSYSITFSSDEMIILLSIQGDKYIDTSVYKKDGSEDRKLAFMEMQSDEVMNLIENIGDME